MGPQRIACFGPAPKHFAAIPSCGPCGQPADATCSLRRCLTVHSTLASGRRGCQTSRPDGPTGQAVLQRVNVAKARNPLDQLYSHPGFLIRRANQIAVWLFLTEAAPLPITTTQYGALTVLWEFGDLDQIGLARLLRVDKSTTALVVSKLERTGRVRCDIDPNDRRRKILRITAAGSRTLRDMAAPAERARRRLLSALSETEAARFVALLERYTAIHSSSEPPDTNCR